ncbi:putative late blight resistance protein homolog R1A-10 [Salvia miltiorrhiza]|uniref:putative late blight resistance protein homolog R1A-10 n=1 Tax=Salvia miltiorrhiza TaxID=226208 RepID=UPI0025AD5914|nr:putative late blight resistance protein homolog R1A-10 [Salvia miltiorrhiza]
MMRWFAETATKLREDYAAELDNDDGGEGGGGDASLSETDDSDDADMVGYSDELNRMKWHMRKAVRPDDWAAASIFGRPGTKRTYAARELFQYVRELQTFHCGVWVTVAPNNHRKDILIGILSQARIYLNCGDREVAVAAVGQGATGLKGSYEDDEEFAIRVNLLNILAGRRYMIVLDNMNETGMLEYLVTAFPVQNNGSVVLVTSSAVNVMNHPGLLLTYRMGYPALRYEDMWWDLLRSMLLAPQPVSPDLEDVGRKAVRNCRGRFFCFVKLIFFLWNADRSVEAWSQVAHHPHHPIFHEIVDELADVRKIREDLNNFTDSDKAVLSHFIEDIDAPTGVQFMKEKLFPERKFFPKMEVISFVGMAGIGKTAFVKKVYEYAKILSEYENIDLRYYKHCVWLTLGPKYKSEDIFIDILAQIFPDIDKMVIRGDADLAAEKIQVLLNKRLFIVLDDVWSEAPLEHLAKSFPNIKGRAFVTTRMGKVARSEKVHIVREMHLLSKEESWKLLCEKVFIEEDNCPFDLRRSGKKIAENCDGLPLTILKIASLVSKDLTAEYWDDVAKKNSDFVSALQDLSETLIPIYSNLPQYLKPCFLYMGVFPEKSEVSASRIVQLWSAEGFLEQGDEQELGAECLRELVDRNLVMRSDTCRLNSVLWYLTNAVAARTSFFYTLSSNQDDNDSIKTARRFCIRNCILLSIKDVHVAMMGSASTAHSFLCSGAYHQYPVLVCWELRLLRVLDAAAIRFYDFPIEAVELIHLRHLAITCDGDLPPTISKLWNLQFLIVSRHLCLSGDPSYLPMEIWDMKELKHVQVTGSNLPIPNTSGAVLPNLVTLLDVGYHTFTEEVLKGIPNLQKLGIQIDLPPGDAPDPFHQYLNRISSLSKLESLECVVVNPEVEPRVAPPAPRSMFPPSLERLSLSGLGYPWEYMNIIEELKNLRVLDYLFILIFL